MPIEHLPADAPCEKMHEILERDGCVVVDHVLDRSTLDQLRRELRPHLEAASKGVDDFDGLETKRIGTLIARSPTSRDVIMHPTVLEMAGRTLSHATNFQLHVTEITSVGPGSKPQPIHRDQWAFDMFPFPPGFTASFATIWALTDFRADNGATRVVPGSHKLENNLRFSQEDTEPAEMDAGSVLLYTGALYHGGGGNHTDAERDGLIIHYTLGWLRQEENQYLCVPMDVLKELPEDLLRLMGYSHGAYSLGFIDGGRDPIAAVRPEFERIQTQDQYAEQVRSTTR